MNNMGLVVLPGFMILAACGGGTTGSTNYSALENQANDRSGMSFNSNKQLTSVEQISSIRFAEFPVGTTWELSQGDFAGLLITKSEPIGGKETLILSSPDGMEKVSAIVGTLQHGLGVTISLLGETSEETDRPSERMPNGGVVNFFEQTKKRGFTAIQDSEVGVGNYDKGVVGIATIAQYGGEVSVTLGARRYFDAVGATDNYQSKTVGTYTYEGLASVFENEDSYTTNTAKMIVDFANSNGTFTAANFTPDENATAKTISINSDVALDNSTGFITSTNGTLSVDGASGAVSINGVLSENNDAVAGAIIPTNSVGGVIGGVFALPQTQP